MSIKGELVMGGGGGARLAKAQVGGSVIDTILVPGIRYGGPDSPH